MKEYNPFGPEEDFNPESWYRENSQIEMWDFGTKALSADLGLIDLSSSSTTLKLKKQKPR